MATATKTAPKPAAKPGPKAPANPPKQAAAPEAPAPKATRTGNSAWAAESVRNQIAEAMNDLWAKGFRRPDVSAVTGFSDSQVWRAANRKVHEIEVPVLIDFIEKVVKGEITPPERGSKKPSVAALEAKINAALEALGDEAKTVAQLRKVVEAAKAALTD